MIGLLNLSLSTCMSQFIFSNFLCLGLSASLVFLTLHTLARYLTQGLSVFSLVLSTCWGEECIILGQDIDSPNDNLKVAS